MILDVAALFGANACLLLAGIGVLRLAAGPRPPAEPWSRVGLAYVAGVAAVGSIAPLLLVAGLDLTLAEILALCGTLFLAGFLRRRRPAEVEPQAPRDRTKVAAACIALVVTFFVLLAVDLVFQPLYRADAWGQWTAKARVITILGGLDERVFASDVYSSYNLDYPLLLPSLEAIDIRFMGFSTQILHLQFGLLLAGFVVALAALARKQVPRLVLWPLLAVLVVAPTVAIQTASAYADLPLAAFFALAAVCAHRWLKDGDATSLALLGLFATAAVATKVEGTAFAAALFVVVVVLAARRSWHRAVSAALVAGAVALVGIVPWQAWLAANGIPGNFSIGNAFSPGFLASNADRVPTIVGTLARDVLDPTSWILLLPLALAAAAVAWHAGASREGILLAATTFVLSLGALVWIYWSTRLPIDYHLETSSRRVVLGPVLVCASLAPFLLADALAAPSPKQRASGETGPV